MKTFIYSILAIAFFATSCSSQKKLVKNAPFELGEASCQKWTGGRPETGSGLLLQIPIPDELPEGISFQEAYFRGRIADLKTENKDGERWVKANYLNANNFTKPDIVSDGDAIKEVGNQPPKRNKKNDFPFELEEGQAVISYIDGDTVKYLKIENIKEKDPAIYK